MAVSGSKKKQSSTSVGADIRARLHAYARGECDFDALVANLKEICKVTADAVWELLSILDQYHRRSILSDEIFRELRITANQIAFGPPPDGTAKPTPARESTTQSASTQDIKTAADKRQTTAGPSSEKPSETAPRSTTFRAAPTHASDPEPVAAHFNASRATDRPSVDQAHEDRIAAARAEQREQGADLCREAARSHSLQTGRVLHDRYTIESAIAFGRRTAVFRARDHFRVNDAARSIAIKVLLIADSSDERAQFEHELRIAQELAHPNIVKAFDLDRDDDLLFYGMELIEGETLSELLQYSPPKRQQAMAIIAQLANALIYLHKHNIVHGDLHPANILISNAGQVKLVDFGAAAEHESSTAWLLSAATHAPPDLIYASCERLAGWTADKRDDVFSLSCIAYQLLGRGHPFHNQLATHARDARQILAPPPDLTPHQWKCLQRGLGWQREQRRESVKEWLTSFSGGNPPVMERPLHAAPEHAGHQHAGSHIPTSAPRITAGTRFASALPAGARIARGNHRTSWTWYAAMMLCLLAALAFAIMHVDLDSAAMPGLAKTQISIRQAINQGLNELSATASSTSRPATPAVNLTPTPPTASNLSSTNSAAEVASPNNATAESEIAGVAAKAVHDDVPASPDADTGIPGSPPSAGSSSESAKPGVNSEKFSESHGRITFVQDTYMVNKHDGAARIKLKREGGANGKVTFVWWAEPGTAELGKDFMSLGKKTETLGNGEREITVFVPLVVGSDNRSRHVFFVELNDASNGLRYGRITRARVVILNE